MRQSRSWIVFTAALFFSCQMAYSGVIYTSNEAPFWGPWVTEYGIPTPEGLYLGYTDNPAYGGDRDLIPLAPKFPNQTIDRDSGLYLVGPYWPDQLMSYIVDWDARIAEVPLGTTLVFPEPDPELPATTYFTFYREVDGQQMPFEEFRPLIGDGPDAYTFDEPGAIDLTAFSFYGFPTHPDLIHIHVVPEPTSIMLGVCLAGFLVGRWR